MVLAEQLAWSRHVLLPHPGWGSLVDKWLFTHKCYSDPSILQPPTPSFGTNGCRNHTHSNIIPLLSQPCRWSPVLRRALCRTKTSAYQNRAMCARKAAATRRRGTCWLGERISSRPPPPADWAAPSRSASSVTCRYVLQFARYAKILIFRKKQLFRTFGECFSPCGTPVDLDLVTHTDTKTLVFLLFSNQWAASLPVSYFTQRVYKNRLPFDLQLTEFIPASSGKQMFFVLLMVYKTKQEMFMLTSWSK